ncbi:MAG: putative secreted protein [Spirosomataceae bacterium]|jgi:predicted secreted protein
MLLLLFCLACQQDSPKSFYEIKTGEEIHFQVASFKSEPYFWEWVNQEKSTYVKLTSRVYFNTIFSSETRLRGREKWTLEGLKSGTDTLRLYLRTYDEDTLNEPVLDSVIIAVKVN